MSDTNQKIIATTTFWVNMLLVSLSVLSYLMGWVSGSYYIEFPSIISTVAYAGFVIYWRFWYVFALPAFYLGQSTYAPRRRLLLTVLSVVVILILKFLLGYQLPS